MPSLSPHRVLLSCMATGLLLCFLTGCGSQSSSASATPTPIPPTPTPSPTPSILANYCNLVSLAEVTQTTGLAITKVTPTPNQAGDMVTCEYVANKAASTGAEIVFFVTPDASHAQTQFMTLEQLAQSQGAKVAALSGVGDQAAVATKDNGGAVVEVRKGAIVFGVGGTTSNPLPLTAEKPLAQLVASRL